MIETSNVLCNKEAEEGVVGALLISGADVLLAVQPILKKGAGDFYVEWHGWVYAAAEELLRRGEIIDFVTVTSELESSGKLRELGGAAQLVAVTAGVVSSMHAEGYARIVRNMSVRRHAVATATAIATRAYDLTGDAQEVIDFAVGQTAALTEEFTEREDSISFKDAISKALDVIEERGKMGKRVGAPTGYSRIDTYFSWRPGSFNLIGARPSVGKTTLALDQAIHLAKLFAEQGQQCLFFSLEMSDLEIVCKALAHETGIDSSLLENGELTTEEWSSMLTAASELAGLPLVIDFSGDWTVETLCAECQRQHLIKPVAAVFVDYMQLLTSSGSNHQGRTQEVAVITRRLKRLAMKLKTRVIAPVQLNRLSEMNPDAEPELTNIRESGTSEQDADTVILLHRKIMQGTINKEGVDPSKLLKVKIAKQRNGRTGFETLWYDVATGRLAELEAAKEPPPETAAGVEYTEEWRAETEVILNSRDALAGTVLP